LKYFSSSLVGEFGAMVRTRLSYVLEFELEKKDALMVQFGLDELNALVNLRFVNLTIYIEFSWSNLISKSNWKLEKRFKMVLSVTG